MCSLTVSAQKRAMLSGKIISAEDKSIIDFATVYLKGTSYGCTTNERGIYHLKAPAGTYTLVVSAIGFETFEEQITLKNEERTRQTIVLKTATHQLDEVVVVSNGVSRVQKSAFNAVALDTRELHNSTKSLSDALTQLPGLKLRESGGVGSDMQLMLDGFSGKHVKIFIDGVPQEGAGTAFDINNIPVNFAERIEVYKGVVPVGFGTDALGGVINIVTNKRRRSWHLDASYSYGSFNTHKSYINFGQTFRNGLMYEINAFQNFSDNDYYIDNYITEFGDDGITENTDRNKIYHVRRFNDQFHNEAIIGKVGLVDKKWADRLMLGFTFSNFYKEIQTGVYQYIVFGEKHRKGHSFVPSLEYSKRNLFTKGLDVMLTANYNHNITNNIDTATYKYNWLGDRKFTGSHGEQSYQDNESKNTNWNGTFTANYRIGTAHTFTLNHVLSTFRRTTRSYVDGSSKISDFSIPKITRKNITGLSYRLMPTEKWNFSAFGKYYNQYNQGPVSQSEDGVGNYIDMHRHTSAFGYGAAGTYFIIKGLQAKLSYEKAYRLPTTDELFGDEDLEAGKTDLRPEKSDNVNFNLSYNRQFGKHGIYVEGTLIYRDTKDYIQRGLSTVSGMSYGIYENHGRVKTKGFNISARYNYSRWFSLGGTYNNINVRDDERYTAENTQQQSATYGQRMPNLPYVFANFDATFTWHGLFAEGNVLTISYDGYYQHEFPLYWERFGDPSTKSRVPEQLSHNLSIGYSIKNGRYNLSLECRNLTDEKLYDNFSLQKAGRAFYGKFRVYFGG
ncbi:TonB-dependent receptor [Bacteroides gallinaceum]|nr:TonB-dependent receptor [Bacteroides gallinaceum]MDN0079502.1 TonB-dependent receptor [Bacteroides gallinaceum]